MRYILPFAIVVLLLIIGEGCQNGPVILSFNPPAGTRYAYTIDAKQAIEPEGLGSNFTINQDMTLEYTFMVLPDSAGFKRVTVTYNRIAIKSGNGMQLWQFDSGDSSKQKDSIFRNLFQFLHRSFTMVVTSKGEVVSAGKLDKPVTNHQDTAVAMDGQDIDAEFNDSSMRSLMMQGLKIYPAGPVKTNDAWRQIINTTMGFWNMTFDNVYTLTSYTSSIAHLSISSNISSNMPKDVAIQIRGLQTGSLDIDIKTGMLLGSKCTQKIKTEMKVNNKAIPLGIVSHTEITGKEL